MNVLFSIAFELLDYITAGSLSPAAAAPPPPIYIGFAPVIPVLECLTCDGV